MKNKKENREERKIFKDRKTIFSAALACAALILAIVFVVSFSGERNDLSIDAGNVGNNTQQGGTQVGEQQPQDPVEPERPTGMIAPIESVSVSVDYEFYHNQTLDNYYHHAGIDFACAAGTSVLAADDGAVESIYTGDVLCGTEIVVKHADGIKTTYRFVDPVESLRVGDKVKKGDVIGVVSEPTGDEYKDGAHLHFEVTENGKNVDPNVHLTLEEK
jgi:murein DD-endopeptidase MepM/ murein hydrolase activator NlpD